MAKRNRKFLPLPVEDGQPAPPGKNLSELQQKVEKLLAEYDAMLIAELFIRPVVVGETVVNSLDARIAIRPRQVRQ